MELPEKSHMPSEDGQRKRRSHPLLKLHVESATFFERPRSECGDVAHAVYGIPIHLACATYTLNVLFTTSQVGAIPEEVQQNPIDRVRKIRHPFSVLIERANQADVGRLQCLQRGELFE